MRVRVRLFRLIPLKRGMFILQRRFHFQLGFVSVAAGVRILSMEGSGIVHFASSIIFHKRILDLDSGFRLLSRASAH